jgi:hypothetical protein
MHTVFRDLGLGNFLKVEGQLPSFRVAASDGREPGTASWVQRAPKDFRPEAAELERVLAIKTDVAYPCWHRYLTVNSWSFG